MTTETPPTVITLTLPTPEGGGISLERATATLLIQRGELAHMQQFHYQGALDDLITAIRESFSKLGDVEDNPPVIPELPEAKPKSKTKAKAKQDAPPVDTEPMIEVPVKKGKVKAVKLSHLKLVGGETDAAAYRQAVLIAGRFIDGGLWDGETPIRFEDVHAVARKVKHLNDNEFSLFSLADFVLVD